jgi:hypothetical protein
MVSGLYGRMAGLDDAAGSHGSERSVNLSHAALIAILSFCPHPDASQERMAVIQRADSVIVFGSPAVQGWAVVHRNGSITFCRCNTSGR